MKKVLIGILILIPIIVLLVVALATNILIATAHIAVQKLVFTDKVTGNEIYNMSFQLSDAKEGMLCIKDYLDVQVYPAHANNYTLEWHIAGDIRYTDEKFEQEYTEYKRNADDLRAKLEMLDSKELKNGEYKDLYNKACQYADKYYIDSTDLNKIIDIMIYLRYGKVSPAVCMANDDGEETSINTSGNLLVNSYCSFTLQAVAENVTKTISVSVVGYDVEQVTLNFAEGENANLNVGESMRLLASYTPIDSIVNHTKWTSSNPSIVKVDENGVVTAVCKGEAEITLEASVYSSESENNLRFVKSAPITINVSQEGASPIFGNAVITSKSTITLEEIGISADDIAIEESEGISIDENGKVTLTGSVHRIALKNNKGVFSIERCKEGAVSIENSKYYNNESGYVLAVGENTLSLNLVWADMLEKSEIQLDNISWSSDKPSIATVDEKNGNVVGISDGIVTITASYGGNTCSIVLNVRQKLSSIQLRTSNESLAIGLARESVFASMKYQNNTDFATEANSVNIIVQGEEKVDSDGLSTFYSAYNFEIVEGSEYGQMVGNKLVFNNNLEGMGKQGITVRVSAKYPKYEGMTRFTTQDVTITAVYGVDVYNIHELLNACKVQEAYAKTYSNVVNPNGVEVFRNEIESTVFTVRDVPYSKSLYSICMQDDCTYRDVAEYDEDGKIKDTIDYDNCAKFYGNLYGNNHMISAVNGQLDKFLTRAKWNGITISNVIMRACEFEESDLSGDSTNVSATNAADFTGKCVDVDAGIKGIAQDGSTIRGDGRASIENGGGITIEYSIFENARHGVNLYNVDINLTGCVIRNMAETGMYVPTTMEDNDEVDDATGKKIITPYYSHINMHNVICSNTLGAMMTVSYESFTYSDAGGSNGHGRFVRDDLEANEQYFLENFYPYGINCVINQTGFYRAYNWQDLSNASLIQFEGEYKTYSDLIGQFAGQIILKDPLFKDHRTSIDGKDYIHYAIICSGVNVNGGFLLNERNYLQFNAQSKDLYELKMSDVDLETFNGTHLMLASKLLQGSSIKVYSYKNDNPIQPGDKYPLNSALIDELHG